MARQPHIGCVLLYGCMDNITHTHTHTEHGSGCSRQQLGESKAAQPLALIADDTDFPLSQINLPPGAAAYRNYQFLPLATKKPYS